MANKNTNMNSAFMLFGLVISLAFVQLYQHTYVDSATHKEAFGNQDISAANANIIAELNALKAVEEDLYGVVDNLYQIALISTSSEDEQKDVRDSINNYIQKIANIDNLRVNLYKNLITNYEILQYNVIDTSKNADAINAAADIVTASVTPINTLNEERTNSQRYVEVNTYYAKRYSYLTDVVKIIIYICIGMIILSSLANNNLIPEWLYSWVLVILLVFGLYFLGKKIFLLFNVDNMDFDRLDWHFTPPSLADTATVTPPSTNPVPSATK